MKGLTLAQIRRAFWRGRRYFWKPPAAPVSTTRPGLTAAKRRALQAEQLVLDRDDWRAVEVSEWRATMSGRLYTRIRAAGATTIGDVMDRSAAEWLQVNGVGPVVVRELRAWLALRGLRLRGD